MTRSTAFSLFSSSQSSSSIDGRLFLGSLSYLFLAPPFFFLFFFQLATIMVPFAGELLWSNRPLGCINSFVGTLSLLFISHLLLLDQTKRGAALRLAILLPTLYLIADLVCNRRYTLGTPFRDTAWGVFGFHLFAKALDVGLVYTLEGQPPPRWCVPEWSKKEDRHSNGTADSKADDRKLAFWQRTPIPKRPRWAIEADHFPAQWRLLPLPTRPMDQLLWAFDVFTLRRHGTSYFLVNEMRALEWSQKRLEAAAKAHETESRLSLRQRRDPHISPFGYSETPWIDAILQAIAIVLAVRYFSNLDVPATTSFYSLPLLKQLVMSLCVGIAVTFASDLPELLYFSLFQRWPFYAPCTSLTPYFRNVARSKTLTDMWSVRWHHFSRRDFVRLNALIPIARKNRPLTVLKSFFWSAVFHSFLFARACQPPADLSHPLSLLGVFYNRGSFGLFLGQGCLVVLENMIAPVLTQSTAYKRCKASPRISALLSMLQSIYVYGSLIWMARWIVAELVDINVFSQENIHSMSIRSQSRFYYELWKNRG